MATLEEGLYAFLAADPAVTALVGTNPVRIRPVAESQGAGLPRVAYERFGTEDDYTLSGNSDQPMARLALDCYAATYAGCDTLARAVKNSRGGQVPPAPRLKEFAGTMGGVKVQACVLDDDSDQAPAPVHGAERPTFVASLLFMINYIEQ